MTMSATSVGQGLSKVSTEDLERLLKAVHRETLAFPVSRSGLVIAAFGDIESHLDLIVGLDKRAAQALLVGVMTERKVWQSRLKKYSALLDKKDEEES